MSGFSRWRIVMNYTELNRNRLGSLWYFDQKLGQIVN